jgi:hypothetical protein
MFVFLNYYELSDKDKLRCLDFLKTEKNNKDPAYKNMWDDDWETKKETLPYILEKTDRFKVNGNFLFLEIDSKIVACSGVYQSQFSKEVYIAGSRLWVNKNYRNLRIPRNYLLTNNKKYAVSNGAKIIALTFNDYNKNLILAIKRNRLGEKNNRLTTRTSEFLFHKGISEVEFPVLIQNTKQWVIYEKIDNDFEFDWNVIKWSSK